MVDTLIVDTLIGPQTAYNTWIEYQYLCRYYMLNLTTWNGKARIIFSRQAGRHGRRELDQGNIVYC
jgi:hypothetical protein